MYVPAKFRPSQGGYGWLPDAASLKGCGHPSRRLGAAGPILCGIGDGPHVAGPAANVIWRSWLCRCQVIH
jgi:hypothetical protein